MDEWLLLQNGWIVYISLFLLLMAGAIGLPVPEDIPLIVGGVLAQRGNAKLQYVFIVCYAAVLLGDVLIYYLGRRLGPALFSKGWFKQRLTPTKIRKVRYNLERRSLLMIFIARHLFYLRTATFLICGAVRMRFSRFLLADAMAALISAPLMIGLGYICAEHYEGIVAQLSKLKFWIFVISALLIFGIGYYIVRKRRVTRERQLDEADELAEPPATSI